VQCSIFRRCSKWRTVAGVGRHTLSRDLAAVRGALSWAFAERAILEACRGKPEREHLVRINVIELGPARRPQAVVELTDASIDLKRSR
jgi:hypothetical protein